VTPRCHPKPVKRPKERARLKRAKPMRRRSEKTAKVYEQRRELVVRLLKERPRCEACPRILAWCSANGWMGRRPQCQRDSVDCHEILKRSAGGSILDEANILCVCRVGHDWIGRHPIAAKAIGLDRSRYGVHARGLTSTMPKVSE
jgi:hypothetical protein